MAFLHFAYIILSLLLLTTFSVLETHQITIPTATAAIVRKNDTGASI